MTPPHASSRSSEFYSSLPPMADFGQLADISSYASLPDDWSIAVADVIDSTGAIRKGEYKAVNTVGAAVIAAVLNAVRPVEVPFIFGGDGASLCVPDSCVPDVRRVLSAAMAMASTSFGLELRAAIVPVSLVRTYGKDVLVARHRISGMYVQGAVHGGGVMFAERLLKAGSLPGECLIEPDAKAGADFSGVECRWKEIPSPFEETLALIVEATASGDEELAVYRVVIDSVTAIYGGPDKYRPVTEEALSVAFSSSLLRFETKLKTWKEGALGRWLFGIGLKVKNLLGWIFFRYGVKTKETDWGVYKADLVSNTDFRKFDGVLRFVLSGTKEQRKELEARFSALSQDGKIRFGIHVAGAALMTCLVVKRQGEHVHFVDASGGGYAMAAKAIKKG